MFARASRTRRSKVRRHQLVLAAEVLIERRLRRVGLRQHAVDAHGPHALPVEQAIGGVEEAVTDADGGAFRPFPGSLSHPSSGLGASRIDLDLAKTLHGLAPELVKPFGETIREFAITNE